MGRIVRARGVWVLLLGSLLLAGCATLAPPPFDPVAYQNDVQLKFETLALIDKSGDKFAAHQGEVQALLASYDRAVESAGKTESNLATAQAWQVIRGPNSAGGYFQMWQQTKKSLSPRFRSEKRAQIARHFDYLICLEVARPGATSATTCDNPLSAPAAPPKS